MALGGSFIIKSASAEFNTTNYSDQLSKTELVPETTVEQLKLINGKVASDVDTPSWTFQIAGTQNHEVATGLAHFLRTNHGQTVEVVFQAKAGAGQAIATFDVIAMAPPFGGEGGSWALMELELPVDGEPVWTVSI